MAGELPTDDTVQEPQPTSGPRLGWKTGAAVGIVALVGWKGGGLLIDHVNTPSCRGSTSEVADIIEGQYDYLLRGMLDKGFPEWEVRMVLDVPSSIEVVDPIATARDETTGNMTCSATLREYDAAKNKATDSQVRYTVSRRVDGGWGTHVKVL